MNKRLFVILFLFLISNVFVFAAPATLTFTNPDSFPHVNEIIKVNQSFVIAAGCDGSTAFPVLTMNGSTLEHTFENSSQLGLYFIGNFSVASSNSQNVGLDCGSGSASNTSIFLLFDDFEDGDVSDWTDAGGSGTFATGSTFVKRGSLALQRTNTEERYKLVSPGTVFTSWMQLGHVASGGNGLRLWESGSDSFYIDYAWGTSDIRNLGTPTVNLQKIPTIDNYNVMNMFTEDAGVTGSIVIVNSTSIASYAITDQGTADIPTRLLVFGSGTGESWYDNIFMSTKNITQYFNAMGLSFTAPVFLNESLESAFQFLQIGNVNVNSASFSNILSGSFNVTVNNTQSYYAAAVPISRVAATSATISCRLLINGSSFGSTITRSVSPSSFGSLYLTTNNVSLIDGGYDLQLQCARVAGTGNIVVSESVVVGHLLVNERNESIGHGFFVVNDSFDSSSFVLLNSELFTTSDLTPDGVHNASIVVNWDATYNYSTTGSINSFVSIGSNNCSFYPRANGTDVLGSVGGDCVLKNAGFNNTYNISFFGSGNGSIFSNVHIKEFINDPLEVNQVSLNGTSVSSSSFVLLANVTVDNLDHALSDLFIKAGVPHVSNSGSTTSNFFVSLDNGSFNSSVVTRTATVDDGVSILHFLFEGVSIANHSAELWGSCANSDCTLSGGDLTGYLVNPISELLTTINVTAINLFNNVSINNFNVTISNGNVFSTTTGTISISSLLATDNFTFMAENFFNSTVLNHDTSQFLQFNSSQSEIRFQAVEFITRNNLSDASFLINNSNQSVFFLNAGLYNVTAFKIGYFESTEEINISVFDNRTINVTMSNANVTFQAFEFFTGDVVSDYNVMVVNSGLSFNQTFSSSGNSTNFFLINGTFSFFFLKNGFLETTLTVNISVGQNSVNMTVFTLSDVQFNFFREEDLTPVINVTFDVFSTVFSGTFNTGASNSFFLVDLPDADYSIRYNTENGSFAKRSYFLRIPTSDEILVNISLLSLENNLATLFLRTVVDDGAQPLEGSLLEIQRPYTSDDNSSFIFRTVEITQVDSQGDAVFVAIANTQSYRLRILTDFQIVNTQTPSFLVDTTSEITVSPDTSTMTNFDNSNNVSFALNYQNSTQFFILDYVSNTGITEVCLLVQYSFGTISNSTETCSSDLSGTIAIFANNNVNGTYIANAYAIVTNSPQRQFILATLTKNFALEALSVNPFGFVGPLLYVLSLILVGAVGFFVNPVLAVLLAVANTAAFGLGFLGLFTFEVVTLGGLMIVAIIILFLLKPNRG